jgi:two-component system cell cycle sensor histidine kinase/response regulator CckA
VSSAHGVRSVVLPFGGTRRQVPRVTTILVVDDELAVCELTCRMLREAGYYCVWATSGEHALTLLIERKEVPDLFVFDVRLQDMPGPTLAWLLTERYGEVPVLFVSGYPSFDAALLRAARWEFLPKPFLSSQLLAAVRRVLAQPAWQARSAS